jgi:hypothetical protein
MMRNRYTKEFKTHLELEAAKGSPGLYPATLEMTEKIKAAAFDPFRMIFAKPIGLCSLRNALFKVLLLVGRKSTPSDIDQPVHSDAGICEKELACTRPCQELSLQSPQD